jgi:hypothetical protein
MPELMDKNHDSQNGQERQDIGPEKAQKFHETHTLER